jgi:hypothetical protein
MINLSSGLKRQDVLIMNMAQTKQEATLQKDLICFLALNYRKKIMSPLNTLAIIEKCIIQMSINFMMQEISFMQRGRIEYCNLTQ